MESKIRTGLTILLILCITLFCYLQIKSEPAFVDEQFHHEQIVKFINEDYTMSPVITTIPGYHVVMTLLMKPFKTSSLSLMRFFNVCFSLGLILIFYLILKKMNEPLIINKTLTYYFLPIVFSLLFLLYTDILSILLVLIALYLALSKKYFFSGLVCILSILIRQNNIIWLGFIFFMIYLENKGSVINHLHRTWTFILGLILFIIFMTLNGGVSMGDKLMHEGSLYLGNIYFVLFLFFIIFLPYNLSNFNKIVQLIKRKKLPVLVFTFLGFLVYIATFKITHPYNFIEVFLRNQLLLYFTSSLLLKSIFFIIITYTIFSLIVTRLKRKSYYLIYLFTFLYLFPSELIEQRYYLIPFTLFILFKDGELVGTKTIFVYAIVSLSLFFGIIARLFFL